MLFKSAREEGDLLPEKWPLSALCTQWAKLGAIHHQEGIEPIVNIAQRAKRATVIVSSKFFCSTLPSHYSTFRHDSFIIHTTSHLQITTSHSLIRRGNLYEGSGTIKALGYKRFLSSPTGKRTGASPVEGLKVFNFQKKINHFGSVCNTIMIVLRALHLFLIAHVF